MAQKDELANMRKSRGQRVSDWLAGVGKTGLWGRGANQRRNTRKFSELKGRHQSFDAKGP